MNWSTNLFCRRRLAEESSIMSRGILPATLLIAQRCDFCSRRLGREITSHEANNVGQTGPARSPLAANGSHEFLRMHISQNNSSIIAVLDPGSTEWQYPPLPSSRVSSRIRFRWSHPTSSLHRHHHWSRPS